MIMTSEIQPESRTRWKAVLDSDERVIWKGRSDGAFCLTENAVLKVLVGVLSGAFHIIFALFWLSLVASGPFLFIVVGKIMFALGIIISFGSTFWPAYRLKRNLYILTNKRAIIMSDIPLLGKKAKSYPITEDTILEFDSKDPGSIYFSSELQNKMTSLSFANPKIGFERISHATKVYRLLRFVQNGEA